MDLGGTGCLRVTSVTGEVLPGEAKDRNAPPQSSLVPCSVWSALHGVPGARAMGTSENAHPPISQRNPSLMLAQGPSLGATLRLRGDIY